MDSQINTSLFSQLVCKPLRCDCVFIVDGVEVNAHKLILASNSPVFEKMFFGDMSSNRASNEVLICDISLKIFNEMLNYIYTHNVDITSITHAWSMFYVADKYLLDDLKESCLLYIRKNIALTNILLCYEYAEMYNLKELQSKCITDICDYIKGLVITDYHMKPSTFLDILKKSPYIKDYYEFIIYLLDWVIVECDEKGIERSAENVVDLLQNYNLIQFINVTDLLESKCVNCGTVPLNCQCFGDLIYKSILLLFKYCKENFEMHMKPRVNKRKTFSIFSYRKLFKIAHRLDLNQMEECVTIISVNRQMGLFGFLINTQISNDLNLLDTYSGSISLRVLEQNSNEQIGKRTRIIDHMSYNSECYVWLDDVIVLRPNVNYELRISYENYLNKDPCSVLCYYMNNNLKRKYDSSAISFYEISGGVVKGVSFYPL